MLNEAHARIKINQLLSEAGWRFFDDPNGPANILLENHVKISQQAIDAWGNDYKKPLTGPLTFSFLSAAMKHRGENFRAAKNFEGAKTRQPEFC